MSNVRALGRRLSCLVAGFFDGSPLPAMLEEAGFEVVHSVQPKETLKALDTDLWQVVFLSDALGTPVLQTVIERSSHGEPPTPVVVVGTTNGKEASALALRLGATDFVAPPFDREALDARLRRWLSDPSPPGVGEGPPPRQLGLTGQSEAMARVHASLARISRYRTDVLIVGERGSGKEQIARALTAMGPRRREPFLPLYCATLDRALLEAELFGHDGQAGAGEEGKRGLLELANGGTLFIDEIGELDLATQARLLRVLERGELRGAGGGTLKLDLGIIAATRTDLEQAVMAKRFREDLFQRLRVATVVVPPLRDRREDIPALAEALIADFNLRNRGTLSGLTPQALEHLAAHDWPGNVRELKNTLESAAVMASKDTLDVADLPPLGARSAPAGAPDGDILTIPATATLSDVERILIAEHLRRARTKADAAKSLGMGLRTLYTKIDKFQLTDLTRRGGRSRSGRG